MAVNRKVAGLIPVWGKCCVVLHTTGVELLDMGPKTGTGNITDHGFMRLTQVRISFLGWGGNRVMVRLYPGIVRFPQLFAVRAGAHSERVHARQVSTSDPRWKVHQDEAVGH